MASLAPGPPAHRAEQVAPYEPAPDSDRRPVDGEATAGGAICHSDSRLGRENDPTRRLLEPEIHRGHGRPRVGLGTPARAQLPEPASRAQHQLAARCLKQQLESGFEHGGQPWPLLGRWLLAAEPGGKSAEGEEDPSQNQLVAADVVKRPPNSFSTRVDQDGVSLRELVFGQNPVEAAIAHVRSLAPKR